MRYIRFAIRLTVILVLSPLIAVAILSIWAFDTVLMEEMWSDIRKAASL